MIEFGKRLDGHLLEVTNVDVQPKSAVGSTIEPSEVSRITALLKGLGATDLRVTNVDCEEDDRNKTDSCKATVNGQQVEIAKAHHQELKDLISDYKGSVVDMEHYASYVVAEIYCKGGQCNFIY